jgi:hypothetical protein
MTTNADLLTAEARALARAKQPGAVFIRLGRPLAPAGDLLLGDAGKRFSLLCRKQSTYRDRFRPTVLSHHLLPPAHKLGLLLYFVINGQLERDGAPTGEQAAA